MNPKHRPTSLRRAAGVIALAGALLVSTAIASDIPDERSSIRFNGIYKVSSSNDPMFPAAPNREYFLDFGKGIHDGKLSGTVAVSMRQNPNVKVRLLAWQYFPEKGVLVIGHPYSEGSQKAVVRAAWRMTGLDNRVVFERGNYTVSLRRPAPGDY